MVTEGAHAQHKQRRVHWEGGNHLTHYSRSLSTLIPTQSEGGPVPMKTKGSHAAQVEGGALRGQEGGHQMERVEITCPAIQIPNRKSRLQTVLMRQKQEEVNS